MASSQLLDLSTLTERDYITIDGERYELHNVGELSLYEIHHVETDGQRMSDFMQRVGELNDEEANELDSLTYRLLDICAVDMPTEVMERLTQNQRIQVVKVFITRFVPAEGADRQTQTMPPAAMSETPTTPASTSPGSNASTAATPSGG